MVLSGDVHFSRVASANFPEKRVTEVISSPLAMVAGGHAMMLFDGWAAAPAKMSLPATHSFNRASMRTDQALQSSAEGAMLLEFYRRGQRAFCTVSNWRLKDIERAQPYYRQEYFIGTLS
jgi:hypothetical protein